MRKSRSGLIEGGRLEGFAHLLDETFYGIPGPETRLVGELQRVKAEALRWKEWALEMEG